MPHWRRMRGELILAALFACACGGTATSGEPSDTTRVDAGTVDATVHAEAEAGSAAPCAAEGTWRITYSGGDAGCASVAADLVFVKRDASGTLHAHFAGRRPDTAANGRNGYAASVWFDAATCFLSAHSYSAWIDSGEGYCGDFRALDLVVAGQRAAGTLERYACLDHFASPDCDATAKRIAGPGDCPAAAVGNEVCDTTAICDSGCSTPCECVAGRWSCDYPKRGLICLPDESCSYRQSALGGYDDLRCQAPFGEPFLDGSLRLGGDLCDDVANANAECWLAAGNTCGACTCLVGDGGYPRAWSCSPW